MRILHVAQFLGIGGLEKVLHMLIMEQIKDGHIVDLLIYDYNRDWVEKFRKDRINVLTKYTKKDGYDLGLIKYLYQNIQDYDIVHSHDLNPMLYLAPTKCLNRLSFKNTPKLIHTTHGMEHLAESKKMKYFEKVLSIFADAIVGVSQNFKDFYINDLKTNSKKVYNIDNGTPVPKTLPTPFSNSAKKKLCEEFNLNIEEEIWVYVARVVPLKGQKIIIEAAKSIKNINFLIIGPSGHDEYYKQIEKDLPKNVRLTGAREDIDHILSGSDVFLSASHHEGIPIAILEAAAMGKPCLLSDIPGHRTIEKKAKNQVAQYFEVENLEDLKCKINDMHNNTELKELLRQNMFETVYNYFSSYRMYQEYLTVYKES